MPLVVLALALVVALVVVPVWPGVYTVDSLVMYRSSAADAISDQYAPLHQWLWGVAIDAGAGPAAPLVAGVALVVAGLYGVYSLQLGRLGSVAATLGTVAFPAVYGFLGWVGRDIWFAGLILVLLALVGRVGAGSRGLALLALAATAVMVADARQNGLPVLVIGVGLAAFFALRGRSRRVAVLGAVLAGLVVAPVGLALAQRAVVSLDYQPQQPLLYQDLLSVSIRLGESQLSRSVFPSQDLDQVRSTWDFGNVGATIFQPDGPVRFDITEKGGAITEQLTDDWKQMVLDHPVTYLGQRARLEWDLLGLDGETPYPYFEGTGELGVQDPELQQSLPDVNELRTGYLEALGVRLPASRFPYLPWLFLVLGCLSAGIIAKRSPRLRLFALTALAIQLAVQLLLAFTAIADEFRFQGYQAILGIVLTVMAASLLLSERRASATV